MSLGTYFCPITLFINRAQAIAKQDLGTSLFLQKDYIVLIHQAKKKKEFVAKNITTDMKMAAYDLPVVNSCICKQIIVGQAKILLCPTIFICF